MEENTNKVDSNYFLKEQEKQTTQSKEQYASKNTTKIQGPKDGCRTSF